MLRLGHLFAHSPGPLPLQDRIRNKPFALYTGRRRLLIVRARGRTEEWPGVGVMYQMRPDGESPALYIRRSHT